MSHQLAGNSPFNQLEVARRPPVDDHSCSRFCSSEHVFFSDGAEMALLMVYVAKSWSKLLTLASNRFSSPLYVLICINIIKIILVSKIIITDIPLMISA